LGRGCDNLDSHRAVVTIAARRLANINQKNRPKMTVRILNANSHPTTCPCCAGWFFTGVCSFGFVLCWYYGLFHLMFVSDKTYISATITVLYVATTMHCFVRTTAISREFDNAKSRTRHGQPGVTGFSVAGANVITGDGSPVAARPTSPTTSAI